jgi:phage baseplate assembly protein V
MNWLRWARVRGVAEGKMQQGRAEVFDSMARDEAMRPQDYGFTSLPVEGQGLVIEAGGHTIILRQDVLASRPQLAAYEVAVWHKEGHMVSLKAGKLVQVDCDRFVVNAAASVAINAPAVTITAPTSITMATPSIVAATATLLSKVVSAVTSLVVAGKEMSNHTHGGISRGTGQSDPPT